MIVKVGVSEETLDGDDEGEFVGEGATSVHIFDLRVLVVKVQPLIVTFDWVDTYTLFILADSKVKPIISTFSRFVCPCRISNSEESTNETSACLLALNCRTFITII